MVCWPKQSVGLRQAAAYRCHLATGPTELHAVIAPLGVADLSVARPAGADASPSSACQSNGFARPIFNSNTVGDSLAVVAEGSSIRSTSDFFTANTDTKPAARAAVRPGAELSVTVPAPSSRFVLVPTKQAPLVEAAAVRM
uniref:Uncharacterized protein n=1 Tax=Arundo donax TaxID=35708 RepID=A0A0A8Y8B4_ARUDO